VVPEREKEGWGSVWGGGAPLHFIRTPSFITNGVSLRWRSAIRNQRSLYPFNPRRWRKGQGGAAAARGGRSALSRSPLPRSHSKLPFRNCFSIRNDQSIHLRQAGLSPRPDLQYFSFDLIRAINSAQTLSICHPARRPLLLRVPPPPTRY